MKTIKYLFLFVIILSQFGCSKKSDEDYMKLADSGIKQNNIPQAVEAYQNLINNYPESPKAPEAMFQLATLYQNKMVKGVQGDSSLITAINLFKNVSDKYPQSNIAPKSLFMSGFILANDLHDYKTATSVFNLFLQKYPDNELAISAKEEIDNMGLSPEEVMQKKKDSKI